MKLKILILFSLFSYIYSLKIGVIGPTGAVGKEILNSLSKENIQFSELKLFGSNKSNNKWIDTPFGKQKIKQFDVKEARECDVNFIAVSGDFSKKYGRALAYGDGGSIVIDNSSAFRYEDDVPLIIPEINGKKVKGKKLIANPNCTTAIALIVLYPILLKYGIELIMMSTYQAASGAGWKGIKELKDGVNDYVTKKTYPTFNSIFDHPLPFNVIPHIDKFQENGYTKEEMKVSWETKKIFDNDEIKVSCTAVRVPTFRAHAESIIVKTKEDVDIDELKSILKDSEGISLVDKPTENLYPMPLTSSDKSLVEVGRVRQNLVFGKKGIEMFVCGDQLLRGAALNAVLILKQILIEDKLVN